MHIYLFFDHFNTPGELKLFQNLQQHLFPISSLNRLIITGLLTYNSVRSDCLKEQVELPRKPHKVQMIMQNLKKCFVSFINERMNQRE